MIAEQWRRVWEIYQEARKLDRDARTAYIESVTTDDEIAREAISLLDADTNEPTPTGRPACRQKGEKVGHYEVIELLGRGGMAEVYTALDCELGRTVALKFVLPSSIGERNTLRRSIREARAASALNHPNIVTIYDVIHEESEIVIAMELVEGRSLREFCRSPLDLDRVIHFGRQVAMALSAVHQKGIIHRDIKPENIIARDDGLVKVLDFGLAREVSGESGAESHSTTALLAGTPRYMAPEQLRGERATGASDVFSLGVVLYELAAGRHPFASRFAWEIAHAIVSRDVAGPDNVNPTIPAGFASLILSMLAKNAAQRPSAERVVATLGDPTSFSLQQSGPRLRYRSRMAAAILMAIVVCAGVFWIARRPVTPRALSITDLTSLASENRVTAAAISPKGDRFVYAALNGIYLRNTQPGPEKPLEAPPGFRCDRLAWLPGGSGILASGSPGPHGKRGIWIISLSGSPPRLVREDAMDAAPSPDGRSIAFVTPGGSEVWIARIDNKGERRIAAGGPDESYSVILWSPDNRRIGYQHRKSSSSNYQWVDLTSGRLTGAFSSFLIDSASILADGRMFFLSQSRLFSCDLWTAEFDPHTGSLRRPARLIAQLEDWFHTNISSTAAGDRLAMLHRISELELDVANLEYPGPRLMNLLRLTYNKNGAYPHAWTPDSQSIIFEANWTGTWDLYEQVIGERSPKVLVNTPADEVLAQMSPDGKWILYLSFTPKAHILTRIPAGGGSPEPVPVGGPLTEASNFHCGQSGRSRCVLKTTEGEQFVFRELDPKLGKGRELRRVPRISGEMELHTGQEDWAISSTGERIAVTARDTKNAYILVFDLDGSNRGPQGVVPVKGYGQLIAVAYAAGDKEWFATARSSGGLQLLYVDQDGRSQVLHEDPIQTWGVPSPDGRRIAFTDHKTETNVVMLEHF